LLRSATVVAYPALYEGFGLPALEALACGAPLVTTSGTAMEEVAGSAAVLVPPGDTRALADVLDELLDRGPRGGARGGAEREPSGDIGARRRRGLEIAVRHTWSASAEQHLVAYHSVVG
jgi:glycosyltransferase involved in cell wall biosynthesis